MSWRSGVYKISNIITGDTYIGATSYIFSRWNTHRVTLRNGRHPNKPLLNSWNTYGSPNFKFTVLMYCEVFELNKYEQFFIDELDPKYNICRIAGTTEGRPVSDKQRLAIAKRNKGKSRPDAVKDKIRKTLLGVRHTEERNMKNSLARKNVPWTQARRDAQNRRVKPFPG
jgi:group I intron endonuclease